MNRIVILTGVSCSGKTSLQKELVNRGWYSPINYTTRKPRDKEALTNVDNEGDFTSDELNEYIFISKENFFRKLKNDEFLEFSTYGGNYYGIRKYMPVYKDIIIILDPIGRSQAMKTFTQAGIPFETYYLDITPQLQLERLKRRGDDEKQILSRKKDFSRFSPTNKCKKLNGAKDTTILADMIENEFC